MGLPPTLCMSRTCSEFPSVYTIHSRACVDTASQLTEYKSDCIWAPCPGLLPYWDMFNVKGAVMGSAPGYFK